MSTIVDNEVTKLPLINRSILQPVWYQNVQPISDHLSEQRAHYIKHVIPKCTDLFGYDGFGRRSSFNGGLSQIPFNYNSESRENFVKQKVLDRNSLNHLRRRDQIKMSNEPFNTSSNYTDDFVFKHKEKFEPIKPVESKIHLIFEPPENHKDEFESLYRFDYKKQNNQMNDKENEKKKIIQFEETPVPTDYATNYLAPKEPTRIYLPKPIYKTPKQPFVGETSYANNFIQHPYSKQNMIAPRNATLNLSENDKDGIGNKTTYNCDYIKRQRDNSLDALKIYQYSNSLIQNIKRTPLDETNADVFHDYRHHMFYKANKNQEYTK